MKQIRRVVKPLRFARNTYSSILGASTIPKPYNEPMFNYEKGSPQRDALLAECAKLRSKTTEIPCIVNGKEYYTGKILKQLVPSDHKLVVANVHLADKSLMDEAIKGALKAREQWSEMPLEERAAVFLRAAELLSSKYRMVHNAATMIGQSKTMWQAEIDSAAETVDFLRFNSYFAEELYRQQPINSKGVWNRMEYRALEGFVAAVSPFNFSAIGSNLAGTPAIMGNCVLWKPSKGSVISNWVMYNIYKEAGIPDGVIQFVPSDRNAFQEGVFSSKHFAGINFTGSTAAFIKIWQTIAANLPNYISFPRIVGETGGKNFHLIHTSANLDSAVANTIRGAFEYSGQKCSATSRLYVPKCMWPDFKKKLLSELEHVKVGQPDDPTSFYSAVIDSTAFKNITGYIDRAKQSKSCEIIYGGTYDDSVGYFIQPTVILTTDPHYETMEKEIFGPVLTVFLYDEKDFDGVLKLIDTTSEYALTGSIFATDRAIINKVTKELRNSAGNFYINDKSTGAVVGQQPFGGARTSGTNDKAGSQLILSRWVSVRAIKENFNDLTKFEYPSVDGINRE
jgi:1-pyrroline-5-carboxylate dehydrogenase